MTHGKGKLEQYCSQILYL